ncbi:hypothetical protein A5724_31650 [Mycobacterium sp. ACS1612]|uniref:hypothetical protein n=1 Tax=Mycobacterium sp. ACS1612 TaxID=1834117 RepID=UPI0008017E1B|nr:hypothetical protein [Mycobacterium sp. ACS1612]OBF26513.1 hypothetical protein A5724_31650 [Mycobacterium sp. ACS1612]
MKKTLIVAGLIGAAAVLTAAPAGADTPSSSVSCSPMPLCQIQGPMSEFQQSVTDYVTKGPVIFAGSVADFTMNGPQTFQGSVKKFVTEGPKTFQRTLMNPGSEKYNPDPNAED